jgi:hypothetical protein
MTDYKLKLRDLRASHTLGWLRFTEADAFFLIMNEAKAVSRPIYESRCNNTGRLLTIFVVYYKSKAICLY